MTDNKSFPLFIIVLGPPASGKGTQAAQLKDHVNLPHVASGDIFRENIQKESELGKEAKKYIDKGALVPDDITIAMVLDRLEQKDTAVGALLDGFPRTIAQAKALDEALGKKGQQIRLVPYIAVPDEVLVDRVSGRRLCRECGHSYHVEFNPPKTEGVCDEDGAELYQRADDNRETVLNRLKVFWEQTNPLIEYYKAKGILAEVNGNQAISDVQDALRVVVSDKLSVTGQIS